MHVREMDLDQEFCSNNGSSQQLLTAGFHLLTTFESVHVPMLSLVQHCHLISITGIFPHAAGRMCCRKQNVVRFPALVSMVHKAMTHMNHAKRHNWLTSAIGGSSGSLTKKSPRRDGKSSSATARSQGHMSWTSMDTAMDSRVSISTCFSSSLMKPQLNELVMAPLCPSGCAAKLTQESASNKWSQIHTPSKDTTWSQLMSLANNDPEECKDAPQSSLRSRKTWNASLASKLGC